MTLPGGAEPGPVSGESQRAEQRVPSADSLLDGLLSSAWQMKNLIQELTERNALLEADLLRSQAHARQLEQANARLLAELEEARRQSARMSESTRSAVEQASLLLRTLHLSEQMGQAEAAQDDPVGPTVEALQTGDEADRARPETGGPDPPGTAPEADSSLSGTVVERDFLLPEPAAEHWERATFAPTRVEAPLEEEEATRDAPAETTPPESSRVQSKMVHVVASPFESLAAVLKFQKAVRQLEGVQEVKAEAFDQGSLRLAVKYSRDTPQATCLAGLAEYDLRLTSVTDDTIHVRIGGDQAIGRSEPHVREGSGAAEGVVGAHSELRSASFCQASQVSSDGG